MEISEGLLSLIAGICLCLAVVHEFRSLLLLVIFPDNEEYVNPSIEFEAGYWVETKSNLRPVELGYDAMMRALETGDYEYICTSEENNRNSPCQSGYYFSGMENGKFYDNQWHPANSVVVGVKHSDKRLDDNG